MNDKLTPVEVAHPQRLGRQHRLPRRGEPTYEKRVRLYANHLALTVRRRGNVFTLSARYGAKRNIGEFRSYAAIERALMKLEVEDIDRANGWPRTQQRRVR